MNIVPYGSPADPSEVDHRYESRKGYVRLDGPAVGDGCVEVFPSSTSYIHHTPIKQVAPATSPVRPRDARGRLLPGTGASAPDAGTRPTGRSTVPKQG